MFEGFHIIYHLNYANLMDRKRIEKRYVLVHRILSLIFTFSVFLSVITLRIDFVMYSPINSNDVLLGSR